MKKIFTLFALALHFAAFSQDGTLDLSFATNGIAYVNNQYGNAQMKVAADGKLVQLITPYTDHEIYGAIRYNADGTQDNSFGTNGLISATLTPYADVNSALGLQPDGRVLLGGQSYRFDSEGLTDTCFLTLLRFTTTGQPDLTFNNIGSLMIRIPDYNPEVREINVLADGRIIVTGLKVSRINGSTKTFIMRFNANGSVDNSFGNSGIADINIGTGDNELLATTILPSGNILVAGKATGGSPSHLQFAVAKFLANGLPDLSFGTNGTLLVNAAPTSSNATATAMQPDGKIILSGNSKYYSYSDEQFTVVRLNADGSIDNTFGTSGMVFNATSNQGSNNKISSVLVQNDGKILIGGHIFYRNTITQVVSSNFTVIRFMPNGDKDLTFKSDQEVLQTGTTGGAGQIFLDCGLIDYAASIAFQGNKIVIAGTTTWRPPGDSFDRTRLVMARLNNSVGAVLPVVFADFSVKASDNTALLNWTTSQEQNVRNFIVERSTDGINFSEIGEVSATGNSNRARQYSFVDRYPSQGNNFYRVKQVDNDARSTRTNVRSVWFNKKNVENLFSVYPVPSKGLISVRVEATNENRTLIIRDMSGSVVRSISIAAGRSFVSLDLSALPKAVYTATIHEKQKSISQPIILQ